MLRPVPPFRLDLTVWALRRRQRNLMDRWDGTTYRRVVVVGGRPTELAVRQAGSSAAPGLSVTATPAPRTVLDRRHVRVTLERLLGLRIDLTDWYHMAEARAFAANGRRWRSSARSNDGGRMPAWCISTCCSMDCPRPAFWTRRAAPDDAQCVAIG